MAIKGVLGEQLAGELVFLQTDGDTGKKVFVRLRPVDPQLDRQYKRQLERLTKGRRFAELKGKERDEASERVDRLERERGCYALVDSKNFEYAPAGPKTAETFSAALGRTAQAGEPVLLDGAWSEQVKLHVFDAVPGFLKWVNDQADKLSGFEAQEEDETAESFR